MNQIRMVDKIASYVPICKDIMIDGYPVKKLMNFKDIYVPIKKLGNGTFGSVTCYRNQSDNNLYALKEVIIDFDNINIKILQDEVEVLSILSQNHHSIVKYYDSFVYDDDNGNLIYVILTEYISGITLLDYINQLIERDSEVDMKTFLNFSFWLMSVLNFIHNKGIIHRDLKPENIMIDMANQKFVIIDFGLSCSIKNKIGNECKLKNIVGTSYYLAPERLIAHSQKFIFPHPHKLDILKKSDIWSAGITLYCLIEKKLPWHSHDLTNLQLEINTPNSIKFSCSNNFITDIVSRLTITDPRLRPSASNCITFITDKLHNSFYLDAASPKRKVKSDISPHHLNNNNYEGEDYIFRNFSMVYHR